MRAFVSGAGAAMLVALTAAQPVWAQNTTRSGEAAPLAATATATPPAGAPDLVVASVKLNGGWRTSKMVGSAVYDAQKRNIGSINDLIVTGKDRITFAILSVGGFLGMGNKLVAVKFDELTYDPTAKDAKVTMSSATKESLAAMPNFTYGND